jgi:hypothetical protein
MRQTARVVISTQHFLRFSCWHLSQTKTTKSPQRDAIGQGLSRALALCVGANGAVPKKSMDPIRFWLFEAAVKWKIMIKSSPNKQS